jgi:hypothetical protein
MPFRNRRTAKALLRLPFSFQSLIRDMPFRNYRKDQRDNPALYVSIAHSRYAFSQHKLDREVMEQFVGFNRSFAICLFATRQYEGLACLSYWFQSLIRDMPFRNIKQTGTTYTIVILVSIAHSRYAFSQLHSRAYREFGYSSVSIAHSRYAFSQHRGGHGNLGYHWVSIAHSRYAFSQPGVQGAGRVSNSRFQSLIRDMPFRNGSRESRHADSEESFNRSFAICLFATERQNTNDRT